MDMASKGQVTHSAADIYDQFFVPALFAEWAGRVADAAGLCAGQAVLDVACGTGVLTREAAGRVRPGGTVSGLDCNDGMLAVARRHDAAVDWRTGQAEDLPFADGAFDAVVSQFGLMFFEDRNAAIAEMWRVLRPGGHLAVAVWAGLDQTPGYLAMTDLIQRMFGADVADALRAPYCLGDTARLRGMFEAAGVADVRVDTTPGTASFPSIDEWVRLDVKGWTLGELIDDGQYRDLQDAARRELGEFVQGDGTVRFSHPAHIVTATRA
ncbi:MAG: methyltransferase domain-containing protein [Rhodobacter sp.]|nr:methyltransferase domain-containing protein [Rhodobacter sp.]